jgi:mannose-1-phosphate guanylyltransferase
MRRRFKTAFIPGAGFGMRLRPLTQRCPKPLLDIGGRPAITYAMDHLLGSGVERFIVNSHHCPEAYLQAFPDNHWRNAPVVFRYEPVLLDTAGGLKNIEDLLCEDEAILCYNGDVISTLPLQELLRFHTQKGAEVTLALRSRGPLLNVSLNERGEICDLRHALNNPGTRSCLFTGIYALETSILRHIEAGRTESIVSILIDTFTRKPGSVMGIVLDQGIWHDIGSIESYEEIKSGAGCPGSYETEK